ncbi:uncharacterized protein LOC142350585 [Convolutriloba macropyga]|uniref:uncharacterized protein LOC142350585 n=1 Tax=Convolutriloba macropyga TaxID=536237 RepID=UPI003F51B167
MISIKLSAICCSRTPLLLSCLLFYLLQCCHTLPLPAAVPQSPDVVVDEPRPVPESESEKKETLRYSTEEETDSKQMQQRNDRYSQQNNAAGLIVERQSEEEKNKFISRKESEKDVKEIEKEQFIKSLSEEQRELLDETRSEGHLKKDQAGPEMPEHHPEMSLEEMDKLVNNKTDPIEDTNSGGESHDELHNDKQGPRMPQHDVQPAQKPRNKIEQVHNHAENKGAGPQFPEHEVESHAAHEEKSDGENKTRERKPEPKPEDIDTLAKTIRLSKDLKLKSQENDEEVKSIEKMLNEKVEDEQTRNYLKLLMKQHIFPNNHQQKNGKPISDNLKDFDNSQRDEEKVFEAIELEPAEFLAFINMIIRDERSHMTDEYFILVQQKVMDNAQKAVDFETRQFGMDAKKREGKKPLSAWVEGFIRFHTPIIHDEN